MAFITAETRSDLIELAVAMLKQAPSAALLDELIALSTDGGSLADAADHIAKTDAFKAEYPSFQTAEQYATEIFDNITTGGTIDAGVRELVIELATSMLVTGTVSKAGLALEIAKVLSDPATLLHPDFADIAQSFQNRADAAEYFVVTKELGGSTAAELAAAIASVTSDAATLTAANAAADATASAEEVVPGQTFTLTTGLDTGASVTGGSGDDTFVGVDNNGPTVGTLTAGDNLVGGEGTDTLLVVASGTPSAPLVSTSSVEILDLTNNSGGVYTLNASLMTGLDTVKVTGGNQDTTVSNSQGNLNIVANTTNYDITTTSATPAIGAADEIDITLTAVGTTIDSIITSDDIETFNVTLTGAASGSTTVGSEKTVTLVSDELETVNISGSVAANLVVDLDGADLFGQVGTVDASAATGNITIDVTAGDSSDKKTSISMGAGDDKVTIGALDKDYTITGGEGTDTLVATAGAPGSTLAAAEYVGVGVSGFEIISAESAGTVDFRSLANNDTFVATTGAGTYSKAGAGIADSYLTATSGTLTLTRATDTAADALNVHIQSATAATVSASVENEETVTVAAAGTGSGITHNLSLTVSDATTLNVIGSNGLNISSLSGETSLATIDAGSHTGSAFTVNASDSTAAMTVTGSAGSESSLGATVNTITTGTGDDTVTGGSYKDVIATGRGDDTINAGDGNNDINSDKGDDVITSGSGNDTIDAGAGDDNITSGGGNDLITTGTGDDTVSAGAGNDMIATASLSSDDNFDGGTGTDRVSTTTGTITSTSATSVNAALIDVTDDVAPTLTGIESLYVSINADASSSATDYVDLDLTAAASLTSLVLETADAEPTKVTNFAGSTIGLYGATTDAIESEDLYIDGVGQSSLTVTLHDYDNADGDGQNTFTGIDSLTIKGQSKSVFTGNASQDNLLGDIVATTAETIAITTTGSDNATDGATALTIDEITGTRATTFNVTVGVFDDLALDGFTASGDLVETSTINVGSDSIFDVEVINFDASALDLLDIDLGAGAIMNIDGSGTITAAKDVDITADSIASLDIDLQAGAEAHLDLSGIEITSATLDVASVGTLTLVNSLGAASDTSSFTFSGRGDVDFDDGTTVTLNKVQLVGDGVTFNTSGLSVDADGFSVNGSAGGDTITTGLGVDVIQADGDGDREVQTIEVTTAEDAAEVVTISILGTEITFTATASDNAAANADDIAATIEASPIAELVEAVSDGTDTVTITYLVSGNVAQATADSADADFAVTAATTSAGTASTTGGDDTVTPGVGADIVMAGAGIDTIALGADSAADSVFFVDGQDELTTITGFEVNSDTITFHGLASITGAEVSLAADAAQNNPTDGSVIIFADGSDGTGASANDDYTDMDDVAAFLDASLDIATSEKFIVMINDLVGDDVYIYDLTNDGTTAAIASTDVTLIGVITNIGSTALDADDVG
jgi:S-layer protein